MITQSKGNTLAPERAKLHVVENTPRKRMGVARLPEEQIATAMRAGRSLNWIIANICEPAVRPQRPHYELVYAAGRDVLVKKLRHYESLLSGPMPPAGGARRAA